MATPNSSSLRPNRPHGFYKETPEWTTDTEREYFSGTRLNIVWPLVKITLISLVFGVLTLGLSFGIPASIGICFLIVSFYQDLVCLIVPNTIRMSPMDQQCFLNGPNAHVNYMNVSILSMSNIREMSKQAYLKAMKIHPKLRYQVKEIAGDYYYQEMSEEEAINKIFLQPFEGEKALRSQQDIDDYVKDNLNEKMPMDGPQVRLYTQDIKMVEDGQ
jgi:hypothetical protein